MLDPAQPNSARLAAWLSLPLFFLLWQLVSVSGWVNASLFPPRPPW